MPSRLPKVFLSLKQNTLYFSQSAFSNFARYVINVVRMRASPGHLFCMVPRKGKPVTLLKILLRRTVNNTIAFNLGCWMNTRKRLAIYELFSCSRVIYCLHIFANSPFQFSSLFFSSCSLLLPEHKTFS